MGEHVPLSAREKARMVGGVAGCLFGAVGIWIVILGLPIGIYLGVTSGDWRVAAAAVALGLLLAIGDKLGWIVSLND